MMGRLKSDQGQLFYEFRLGDAVPEDHLVRKIDTGLDLSWLRSELAPHYSRWGVQSIPRGRQQGRLPLYVRYKDTIFPRAYIALSGRIASSRICCLSASLNLRRRPSRAGGTMGPDTLKS